MTPWIKILKSLQDTDLRLKNLNLKLVMIPKEKLSLKNQALKNKEKVANLEKEIKTEELNLKQCESQINSLKDQSDKLKQQSAMVKKNTEYQAMLKTIEDLKEKVGDLELKSIEFSDEIEAKNKTLRKLKSDISATNAGLKEEFFELDSLEKELKVEVAKYEKEREEKAKMVDSEILARYNSLLKGGSPKAFALVTNGICENCHLRVTPQTLNILAKKQVAYCDNCMHLIYIED